MTKAHDWQRRTVRHTLSLFHLRQDIEYGKFLARQRQRIKEEQRQPLPVKPF